MAPHVGAISHQKPVQSLLNRQTPSDPRRYLCGTGVALLVTQSAPAFQNTLTSMLTGSVRKDSSGFCVPAQLRDAKIVKRGRTIEAVRGYSMGPVLRTRTTLPENGVANVAKKGRSNPFSLYSSMTCASTPANHGMQASQVGLTGIKLNQIKRTFW